VQLIQVVHTGALAFLQLGLAVRLNELVDTHKATADTHYKLIIHDLCKDLPRSEHVETCTQSRDRQVHTHLIDVFLEHLVNCVTSNRTVSLLLPLLIVKLLSVEVSVVDANIKLTN